MTLALACVLLVFTVGWFAFALGDSLVTHSWMRLRRHHWRIETRRVYGELISERYECVECGVWKLEFY